MTREKKIKLWIWVNIALVLLAALIIVLLWKWNSAILLKHIQENPPEDGDAMLAGIVGFIQALSFAFVVLFPMGLYLFRLIILFASFKSYQKEGDKGILSMIMVNIIIKIVGLGGVIFSMFYYSPIVKVFGGLLSAIIIGEIVGDSIFRKRIKQTKIEEQA